MKDFKDLTLGEAFAALERGAYANVNGNTVELTDPDGTGISYSLDGLFRDRAVTWISQFNTAQTFPVPYAVGA